MPFCPNCKETFPKGVVICSKCNVPLNNETSVETVPVFALQREDAAQKFIEYMQEQGIEGSYRYSMRENAFKVYVDKPDVKKAVKLFASFYVMESKRRRGEDTDKAQTDVQPDNGEEKPDAEETKTEESTVQEDAIKEESTEAPQEEATTATPKESVDTPEEATASEELEQNTEEASVEEAEPTESTEETVEEAVAEPTEEATETVTEPAEEATEIVAEPAEPEANIPEEPISTPSEIVSPTEESEPTDPVSTAPQAKSAGSRKPFRNLFIGRLRRSEENNPSSNTPEAEATASADDDKIEAIVEETTPAEEGVIATTPEAIVEETVAETLEETVEETVEETIETVPEVEDVVEETIEEVAEVVVEEPSEEATEAAVEEVTEETTEETTEEAVEEVVEEVATEEIDVTPAEVVEEPVAEVIEEVIEEPVAEVVEEVIEEPVAEVVEEVIEEPVAEVSEEVIEEPVAEVIEEVVEEPVAEVSEEVVETTDDTITAPFEYIPEPEETISEEIAVDEVATIVEESVSEETTESITESVAEGSVIEEIIPDASLYRRDASEYESVSLRPTDIQDTKIVVPLDYDIIEEVIASDNAIDSDDIMTPGISSFADPSKAKDNNFRRASKNVHRYATGADDLDSQTFKAFVPDYTLPSAPEMDPEDETEKAFEEFKKRIKERKSEQNRTNAEQQKERIRLANLSVDLGKGRKLIFEDNEDLDSYAGFVPDYTPNPDEMEAFEYYKPHSVSDYSRFKKSNRTAAAAEFVSGMRLTSPEETMRLFSDNVPEGANRIINPSEVRTSNFILSMNGRQLILLFNSWMLLNISLSSVKAFESEEASDEENFKRKIEGIKKRITDTFGAINESFLDNLVHKYYARYLDD